jgi:hypothetical protein
MGNSAISKPTTSLRDYELKPPESYDSIYFYDGKKLHFHSFRFQAHPKFICVCGAPHGLDNHKCKWKLDLRMPEWHSQKYGILPHLFKNPIFIYYNYIDSSVYACDNFFDAPLPFECPLQDLVLNSINLCQRIPKMSRIKWEIEKALQSSVTTDVLGLIKAYVHVQVTELFIEGHVFDLGITTSYGYKLKMKISKLIDRDDVANETLK